MIGWGSEDNEFGQRSKAVFHNYPIEWGAEELHGTACPFLHMQDDEEGAAGSHSNVDNNDAVSLGFFLS